MDVIELTRELGKAIQQDDRFIAYNLAKQANDNDEGLQADMDRFSKLRADLGSAMSAEEPDRDNIAALDKELKEVYGRIMKNPNMIVFEGAQQNLENLVNNIQQIITLQPASLRQAAAQVHVLPAADAADVNSEFGKRNSELVVSPYGDDTKLAII